MVGRQEKKAQKERLRVSERKFYANFIVSHKNCFTLLTNFFSFYFFSSFSSLIAYKFKIIHQKADVEASPSGCTLSASECVIKMTTILLRKIFSPPKHDHKQGESNLISSHLRLPTRPSTVPEKERKKKWKNEQRNRFFIWWNKTFLSSRKSFLYVSIKRKMEKWWREPSGEINITLQ